MVICTKGKQQSCTVKRCIVYHDPLTGAGINVQIFPAELGQIFQLSKCTHTHTFVCLAVTNHLQVFITLQKDKEPKGFE